MSRLQTTKNQRLEKLEKLKKLGVTPFAYKFNKKHSISQSRNLLEKDTQTAGRIMAIRGHGALVFIDLVDETGKIQLLLRQESLSEKENQVISLLDIGDFVGVSGKVVKSKTGEISIEVEKLKLLSKSLSPLPSQWYGLKDTEERYRQRYLDLLLNPKTKEIIDKRWATEKAIREYFWSQNYQEVETPVLQNLYGGTNAKPFITHLNALGQDMYLRIAPELYLKRLIIGGYDRVFEIARNFRNEGLDLSHQPEFTMVEFYEAYADYHRLMDIIEELTKFVAKKVNGGLKLEVNNHQVDLSGKWRRITIDQALKEYLGIDWEKITDQEVKDILKQHNFTIPGVYTKAKALFTIYDHLVTPKLIQPTFVFDYPKEISPLSKIHRSKDGRVERLEGYVGGKEIYDGWSEVISPIEQRKRFETEQKNMKAGDQEAQPLDEEFLRALEFGCPPLGGIGFGVDRLVMFLTNTWNIKEVIAFPLMRPRKFKTSTNKK